MEFIMRKALIVQGGWDGHEPKLVSERFKKMLEAEGFSAEIHDTLDAFNDAEALLELDLFIDGCVMNKLEQITVIHGKGTGALRTAVQSHLKKHKNVRTFRSGVYGEGETGVTIAQLK